MDFNFSHGANIYKYENQDEIIDFSSNTNPLGLPLGLEPNLHIYQEQYTRYPDQDNFKLRKVLADYEHVNQEYIYIGNGASDIIFRLILALKPQQTLLLAPTFSEYEKALVAQDSYINYYYLNKEHDFGIQSDILSRITSELSLLILCNPNNPTGKMIDPKLLENILKKCYECKVYILMDECFIDFVTQSKSLTSKNYMEEYSNLIVLKAFTKTYAMAGFRLGYCLTSNRELIKKLPKYGQDWSVSTIAQEIGYKILSNKECLTDKYLIETIALLFVERDYLTKGLEKLNMIAYKGQANYIFFRYEGNKKIKKELLKRNILIRSCVNYRGLDSTYYRISIKKRSQNQQLLKAMQEVLGNG